jgi:hypothetical protein
VCIEELLGGEWEGSGRGVCRDRGAWRFRRCRKLKVRTLFYCFRAGGRDRREWVHGELVWIRDSVVEWFVLVSVLFSTESV